MPPESEKFEKAKLPAAAKKHAKQIMRRKQQQQQSLTSLVPATDYLIGDLVVQTDYSCCTAQVLEIDGDDDSLRLQYLSTALGQCQSVPFEQCGFYFAKGYRLLERQPES